MQGGQSPYLFTNKDTFKDTKVGQGIIYRGLLIREVVSFMCYYMHASNVRLFIWNMCTLCTIPEMHASNVRLFISVTRLLFRRQLQATMRNVAQLEHESCAVTAQFLPTISLTPVVGVNPYYRWTLEDERWAIPLFIY